MSYYENELVDRAVNAYFRRGKSQGFEDYQIMQPARSACLQRGRTITIANSYVVLAKYRVTGRSGSERLRHIELS